MEAVEQEPLLLIVELPAVPQNCKHALIQATVCLILMLFDIISKSVRTAKIVLRAGIVNRRPGVPVQIDLGLPLYKAGIVPVQTDRKRYAGKTPLRVADVECLVRPSAGDRMLLSVSGMEIPALSFLTIVPPYRPFSPERAPSPRTPSII